MNLIGAEAEQSVLGAILIDSNVLDEIVFLEERDFATPRHQQLYKVMRYLEKKGQPVDIVSVTETYAKFGHIESLGGVSYLSELADSCPTTANVEYYARIIRSKALGRRGHDLGNIIAGMNRDDYETDEEYFSYIEQLVSEMRPDDTARMKNFTEMKESYFKHLKTPPQFITTNFEQFDTWCKGLARGDLFVSAGRPSVGKTALLLQRIQGAAMQNKGACLLFSQEMDKNQVIDRWISSSTGISYPKIRNKDLSADQWSQLEVAYEMFEDLPLFVQDSAGVTIDEVRATAKQIKKKHGRIAVIAVDYLQIMKIPQQKGESRSAAIGRVTTAAKQIAREIDCCFIMLSQLSRGFEQAQRPQFSHLKESGSIEQDADVIEFLWHNPNDTAMGGKVIQQTIAKGRNIGLNDFRLMFQGIKQHFRELPSE